jgi:hypothetical protein
MVHNGPLIQAGFNLVAPMTLTIVYTTKTYKTTALLHINFPVLFANPFQPFQQVKAQQSGKEVLGPKYDPRSDELS